MNTDEIWALALRIQRIEDELRDKAMAPLLNVGNGRQRTLGEIALDLTRVRRDLEALLRDSRECACGGRCRRGS